MTNFIELPDNPKPAFENNNVPIALSSSDYYVPYLSVVLESIIENASDDFNYDIIILNKDISNDNKLALTSQCEKKNIRIRFYNVSRFFEKKDFFVGAVAVESYFRVILPDILKKYDKIIFLDCDIIVNEDIARLFCVDINDYYLAAAKDINLIACYHIKNHWKPYLDNKLHLQNPYNYFQAGVMSINLNKIRKDLPEGILLEICSSEPWKLLDQDVLNMMLQKRIKKLGIEWNVMTGEEGRYEHVIKNAPKNLSKEYIRARKNPKIIHFCGKKKPWLNAEIEYATVFWKYARTSPFYEVIMQRNISNTVQFFIKKEGVKALSTSSANSFSQRATESKKKQNNKCITLQSPKKVKRKYVLFRVLTFYQLINAIQLKLTELKSVDVDIILSSATDFTKIIKNLEKERLFNNIYVSKDTPEDYFPWKQLGEGQREEMICNPSKHIFDVNIKNTYTDYYIATIDPYNQLFYYYLLQLGNRPTVHLFEDGLSTYLIDYSSDTFWKHELYKEYSLFQNIKELLLYEPLLYATENIPYALNVIPKINYKDSKICKIFTNVFGDCSLPEERYIFLEEPFIWDGITSTDMDLIELLAEQVGKENIRVKLHPRNGIDRFTPRGYKVFDESKVPWEMYIMNSNLENKVIVTVSSTAAFTAGMVFGKKFRSINLYDMMLVGKTIHINNPKFKEFYSALEKVMNNEQMQIFKPSNSLELKESLLYTKGVMK